MTRGDEKDVHELRVHARPARRPRSARALPGPTSWAYRGRGPMNVGWKPRSWARTHVHGGTPTAMGCHPRTWDEGHGHGVEPTPMGRRPRPQGVVHGITSAPRPFAAAADDDVAFPIGLTTAAADTRRRGARRRLGRPRCEAHAGRAAAGATGLTRRNVASRVVGAPVLVGAQLAERDVRQRALRRAHVPLDGAPRRDSSTQPRPH